MSCLSLGVCKEKHEGKGILPQAEGRFGLKILLPEPQWCQQAQVAVWPWCMSHPLWAYVPQSETAWA